MRRRIDNGAPVIARVNIIPLMDVALVLVLILLMTTPMFVAVDLGVTLPQARTRGGADEQNISITLSPAGVVAIDDVLIPPGELTRALSARLAGVEEHDVLVVVRADQGASYGAVRTVLENVRSAGAERMAIATRHNEAVKP